MSSDDRETQDLVSLSDLHPDEPPVGVDRRAFMMRSAVVGAMSVITGCAPSPQQATAATQPPAAPPHVLG